MTAGEAVRDAYLTWGVTIMTRNDLAREIADSKADDEPGREKALRQMALLERYRTARVDEMEARRAYEAALEAQRTEKEA